MARDRLHSGGFGVSILEGHFLVIWRFDRFWGIPNMSGFWNMFGGRKSLRKSSQIGPPMFHLINTSPVFFQVCAPETVLWGVKGMIIGIQKYRNTKIILNKSTQNRGRSSLYFHFWAVFPQPEYTHTEMMLQKPPPIKQKRGRPSLYF